MHVTIRMLKVFEAAARHLSFTRAAQELHLSQPAVSIQIKQLEEAAGLSLFEQLGKKMFLTDAGREMYHYSRRIAETLREADDVLSSLRGGHSGRLDISVASTATQFGTHLLATFSSRYPAVTYRLDVTNRQSLIEQLENNEKDLVIMGRPPEELDVEMVSFLDNPLVVIAPPGHPLSKKVQIPLAELAQERFVVREEGSGTRIAMERFFSRRRVRVKAGIELTSNEAIKHAVRAGLGLGIVSAHALGLELKTGVLIALDVEEFPILRHWYVVWRRNKRLSPVAAAFKDYVVSEGAAAAKKVLE